MVYAIDKLDGETVSLWADTMKIDMDNRTITFFTNGKIDDTSKDKDGNIYATFYLDNVVGMYNMDDIVGFREVLGLTKEMFENMAIMANLGEYADLNGICEGDTE